MKDMIQNGRSSKRIPAQTCRWSGALAVFLDSMQTQLISRRLVREAADYWVGSPAVKLDIASVRPVAEILFSMASVAVFHKDENLSEAAPAAVAALSCVLPEKCLPFVVRTIHETLASAEAVHRTLDAMSLFAGTMLAKGMHMPMCILVHWTVTAKGNEHLRQVLIRRV